MIEESVPFPNQQSAISDQQSDVLDGIASLVNRSLLRREEGAGGEPRLGMLETIREYGQECLDDKEAILIRDRHAHYFLEMAERSNPALKGPDVKAWLHLLHTEHDNLRSALDWWSQRGEAEGALQLGGALGWFWQMGNHWNEGRNRLENLLAQPGASGHTAARARALLRAGDVACFQGDATAACALVEESLEISRELGEAKGIAGALEIRRWVAFGQSDRLTARSLWEEAIAILREVDEPWGVAMLLVGLSRVVFEAGDAAAARGLAEESLALFREVGSPWGLVLGHLALGFVAHQQRDDAAARASYEESRGISREIGDACLLALSLGFVADVAVDQGEYETARSLYEESLALWKELGARRTWLLRALGDVARLHGDYASARTLYSQSLTIDQQHDEKPGIARCLEGLAAVAGAEGEHERAARLFGAAAGVGATLGADTSRSERADRERRRAAAREALGESRWEAAWRAGHEMTPEELLIAD